MLDGRRYVRVLEVPVRLPTGGEASDAQNNRVSRRRHQTWWSVLRRSQSTGVWEGLGAWTWMLGGEAAAGRAGIARCRGEETVTVAGQAREEKQARRGEVWYGTVRNQAGTLYCRWLWLWPADGQRLCSADGGGGGGGGGKSGR